MPFWAILGAFLLANAVPLAITFASMLYQRKRQKKLAAELDKQKGFDLVVDGEPINLPLVYGYQKVGGVRTFHKTASAVKQRANPDNQGWKYFKHPNNNDWFTNGSKDHSQSKNVYLMTQQALCFGGISDIIDLEVNSQSYNKGKFSHYLEVQMEGSRASASATASGIPATNKFTNTAWINAMFWLNRNDYNYQGVPNISAYVKGQKVWTLKNTNGVISLDTKTFSNNNAYVLMDYMLRPKSLGGVGLGGLTSEQWIAGDQPNMSRINIGSFFNAANICDTVVQTENDVRGRVNGVPPVDRRVATSADRGNGKEQGETVYVEDIKTIYRWEAGAWVEKKSSRQIKLYECNITIDTGRPFRDNIELLLETMGESEMTFTEGKYKLILDYPENETEQNNLVAMTITDADIVSEDFSVSYPGAADRLNRVIVKFKNEEHDFVMDSVSWPKWGDANHTKMLNEDSGIESEQEIFFPGCSIRHLALAKAENMVRQSRLYVGDEIVTPGSGRSANQKIISFTLDRRGMVLETGDLIKVNSVTASITDDVFRIETIKYTKSMNVEITASQFNYTNLKYASKSSDIPDPRSVYDGVVPNVRNIAFNAGVRQGATIDSNGYLTWQRPLDEEVRQYIVSTSTDNVTWEQLGGTRRRFFDIPAEYDNGADRYFNVRVENTGRVLNDGVTIFVNNLQAITPITAIFTESSLEAIDVNWTGPAPAITRHYQVYVSKTNTKPAQPFKTVRETFVTIGGLKDTDARFIWVDVVGYSGTVGAMTTPVSQKASLPAVEPGDIFKDPASPTNLAVTSSLDDEKGKAKLRVTWSEPSDMANVVGYRVRIKDVAANDTFYYETAKSPFVRRFDRALALEVSVESVNGAAKGGGYLTPVTHTTASDSVAPAVPSSVVGTGGFNTVWLEWVKVTDKDVDFYEITRTTKNAGTPGANPSYLKTSTDNHFVLQGLADKEDRDYYVRSVDTSGNKSSWSTKVNVVTKDPALTGITSDDIAGIVNENSFVNSIEPIKVVSTLPNPTGYTGSKLVLLTTDGKTYRYHNGAWTAAVPVADIQGQIPNSKIQSIDATKINGQIQEAQIAGFAASKITGQLTNDQIASVNTAKLTGTITSTQISDNAISTPKLAAGAVNTSKIAAGSIVADKIASNAVTSDKIQANAVNASKIAAGSIDASKITSGAVTTAKLAVGSGGNLIENSNWVSGTVTLGVYSSVNSFTNAHTYRIRPGNESWSAGFGVAELRQSGTDTGEINFYIHPVNGGNTSGWTCEEGAKYSASAQLSTHRCRVDMYIFWRRVDGGLITSTKVGTSTNSQGPAGSDQAPDLWPLIGGLAVAPTGARYAQIVFTKFGTTSGNDSYLFVHKPMLAKTHAEATEVTPYSPSGATLISGNEIMTGAIKSEAIAANAITAVQIAANAISASEISANAITSDKIQANAVTVDKLAANSVSAGKIQAGAISADKLAAKSVIASKIAVSDLSKVFSDDFSDPSSVSEWEKVSGGDPQIYTSTDPNTRLGSGVLKVGNNSGNDEAWLVHKKLIPFDPEKTYRFTVRVYAREGARNFYAGFTGIGADGGSRINAQGVASYSTQHYVASSGAALPHRVWTVRTGYLKGWGNPTGDSSSHSSITDPAKAHRDVRYMRPMLIINYPDASGYVYVDSFEIEELTGATLIEPNSITTTHVGANQIITNAANIKDLVVTDAKIANATISGGKLRDVTITDAKIANGTISGSKIRGSTITGSHIAGGTITGAKIAGSTITGGNISTNTLEAKHLKAGTITGDKISGNTISADKLTVGSGTGNILLNTGFDQDLQHWFVNKSGTIGSSNSWIKVRNSANYSGRDFPVLEISSDADNTGSGYVEAQQRVENSDGSYRRGIPVTGGKWYQVSARVNSLRARFYMEVRWYDDSGSQIGNSSFTDNSPFSSSTADPGSWRFCYDNVQAPASAETAVVCYRLKEVTSTGRGYIFIHQPQFIGVENGNVQAVPFSPGGTTIIHGGSIRANTISADMGIFNDGIKSSNFNGTLSNNSITNNGSAGFAIAKNGDAVFNNLVTRGWVVVGAVSDGGTVYDGSARKYNSGNIIKEILINNFEPGSVFTLSTQFEARHGGNAKVGETCERGGPCYDNYADLWSGAYLVYRRYVNGAWTGWIEVAQWRNIIGISTYYEHSWSGLVATSGDQIQARLICDNKYDSVAPVRNNFRRVGLYLRALVR